MVAKKKTMQCELKFKVTKKGIRNVSEDKLLEGNDGQRSRVSIGGSKRSEAKVSVKTSMAVNSGKRMPEMYLDGQRWKKQKIGDESREGIDVQRDRISIYGNKHHEAHFPVKKRRRPDTSLGSERLKKQKMDDSLKLECNKILKHLMSHTVGWVFSEPVDPVKLQTPDYFKIVKYPMDLGTIKRKLEGDMYSDSKEFADDVKLTFENAKLYNPPGHEVHYWAEILDDVFSRRWKNVEAKLNSTNKNDEQTNSFHYTENNGQHTMQIVEINHRVMKPVEERRKSRLGLMKVKPRKVALSGCSSLDKTAEKGHCNRSDSASADLRQSINSTEAKCSSCVSETSHCLKNIAAQTSASDISSERSTEYNNFSDSKLVSHEYEKSPHATPGSFEGCSADAFMSPEKALRAAMLKSRFADTIFKATHISVLNHGEKSGLSRMIKERERLEYEQLKERARIEAEIKAAEAALRMKDKDDLKMQRERERKAARMALEKMERSVEIETNASIMKDLEILIGFAGFKGYPDCKALARIGLYRKDDYLEENEDAILNAEEGEITS